MQLKTNSSNKQNTLLGFLFGYVQDEQVSVQYQNWTPHLLEVFCCIC